MDDLKKLYELAESSCNTDEELATLCALYDKLKCRLDLLHDALSYCGQFIDFDEIERRLKLELALDINENRNLLLYILVFFGKGKIEKVVK